MENLHISVLNRTERTSYLLTEKIDEKIKSIILFCQKYKKIFSIYFSNVIINGFHLKDSFLELLEKFLNKINFEHVDGIINNLKLILPEDHFVENSLFGLKIHFTIENQKIIITKIYFNEKYYILWNNYISFEKKIRYEFLGDYLTEYLNLNYLIQKLLDYYCNNTNYLLFKGYELMDSLVNEFPIDFDKIKKFNWKKYPTDFLKPLFELTNNLIQYLNDEDIFKKIEDEILELNIIDSRKSIVE